MAVDVEIVNSLNRLDKKKKMYQMIVLLYSKYSKACTILMDWMSKSIEYRKICIDHESFRSLIAEDAKKYQIRVVPTLFIFHGDGRMDKYEGSDAFSFIKSIQRPPTPPLPPPPPVTIDPFLTTLETIRRDQDTTPVQRPQESKPQEQYTPEEASTTTNIRKMDQVKSLALQMQQERESEDPDLRKG